MNVAWLFRLPQAQVFIEQLVNALADRQSVLVLTPAGFDADDLSHQVLRQLRQEAVACRDICPRDEYDPVDCLALSLDIDWGEPGTPHTIESVLRFEGLPDVLCLSQFAILTERSRAAWVRFLSDWAQVSHRMADRGLQMPALYITASALALPELPRDDIYLRVYRWKGIPSALEMQLLCRLNGNAHDDPRARWRENVLPSLAGNDLNLAAILWDESCFADADRLADDLLRFAGSRGWDKETLRAWGAERALSVKRGNASIMPDLETHTQLWARGLLWETPEYGIELHTAALALLSRTEDIRHRLWRAQAHFLLPLIDQLRRDICERLTYRFGHDWPLKWEQPSSQEDCKKVSENPMVTEWPHLTHLLSTRQELKSVRELAWPASLAHRIRNEIAHYRPVCFADFERFWDALRGIRFV